MIKNKITKLYLENFRNFSSYQIKIDSPTIFVGENGIGKTSILEAISLASGRGLRSVNYSDISNYRFPEKTEWLVSIEVVNEFQTTKIAVEYKNLKKIIRINGKQIKNFNEILDYLRLFWVTQSDYHQILISNIYRRNFLDRAIAQFIPNYYNHLVQYKHYLVERNKILLNRDLHDDIWLDEIEKNLSKLNILISKIRNDVLKKINSESNIENLFNPILKLDGDLERKNLSDSELIYFYKQNRNLHAQIKRCNLGIHLTKIEIVDSSSNKDIDLLSSGEQRLLLNQLMINLMKIQKNDNDLEPIMLLDDILTFFDEKNQNLLIKRLLDLNLQFFITTNNFKIDRLLLDRIQIIDNIKSN